VEFYLKSARHFKNIFTFYNKKNNEKYPNFINNDCNQHFMYILNLLFITKICKDCKEGNNQPAGYHHVLY